MEYLKRILAVSIILVLSFSTVGMMILPTLATFANGQFAQYYDQIENNPSDFALAGIFNYQQTNGSICRQNTNCIRETYYTLKALRQLNLQDSKITQAYNYLVNATPKNTIETTYILEVKHWQGTNLTNELANLLTFQNSDGGFAFKTGYSSDLLTTLAALRLLNQFSNQYSTEKNNAANYLNNFLKNNALSFSSNTEPNLYLNTLLLEAYASLNNHPLKTKAQNFLNSILQQEDPTITLETAAYLLFLQDLLIIEKNKLEYLSNRILNWQDINGLIQNNLVLSSLALAFLKNHNNPPIAQDDTYTTPEDTTPTITLPGVLANDSDPENDSLTTILVTDVSQGSLTLNTNGSFTYIPNPNYHGTDTFTYKANDGKLNSEIATVQITITPIKQLRVEKVL